MGGWAELVAAHWPLCPPQGGQRDKWPRTKPAHPPTLCRAATPPRILYTGLLGTWVLDAQVDAEMGTRGWTHSVTGFHTQFLPINCPEFVEM